MAKLKKITPELLEGTASWENSPPASRFHGAFLDRAAWRLCLPRSPALTCRHPCVARPFYRGKEAAPEGH